MDDTRRKFLTFTGLGLALAVPARALAQSPRILRESSSPHPVAPAHGSPELQRFAGALHVTDTVRHGALDVLWLGGPAAPATLTIVTLEDARTSGQIAITERARATVPDLVVENRGTSHVLMLAGEILIGGKQDRVLKEDVLLPPLSGPRNIGVFCVEQGRWSSGGSEHFQPQGMLAAPSLRHQLMDKADQRQVWSEVDRAARAAAAPPASGSSYQRVYAAPEVKRHVQDVERVIDPAKVAGALGAAVFVGTRVAGIDAFRDTTLFARQWPKLLRAYAVDAMRAPGAAGDVALLRTRTLDTLRAVAGAFGTAHGNAGVGHVFEFPLVTARGSALIAEAQVIHLAVL
jgi:hypothetical protein